MFIYVHLYGHDGEGDAQKGAPGACKVGYVGGGWWVVGKLKHID